MRNPRDRMPTADPETWIGEWLALSIRDPEASLIRDRIKWTENRTWDTAVRGPILIHRSGGAPSSRGILCAVNLIDVRDIRATEMSTREGIQLARDLLTDGMPRAGLAHISGRYCFVVRHPVAVPGALLPVAGRLGFWRCRLTITNGRLTADAA